MHRAHRCRSQLLHYRGTASLATHRLERQVDLFARRARREAALRSQGPCPSKRVEAGPTARGLRTPPCNEQAKPRHRQETSHRVPPFSSFGPLPAGSPTAPPRRRPDTPPERRLSDDAPNQQMKVWADGTDPSRTGAKSVQATCAPNPEGVDGFPCCGSDATQGAAQRWLFEGQAWGAMTQFQSPWKAAGLRLRALKASSVTAAVASYQGSASNSSSASRRAGSAWGPSELVSS